MISSSEWSAQRSQLLVVGVETQPHFNIARHEPTYDAIDLVLRQKQRVLCFPSHLNEEVLPLHPTLMPFKPYTLGNLASKGVTVLEVPSGTSPLLRVAQSFDTPKSGAPSRADIFRQAGVYVASHWVWSGYKVPQEIGLRTLSYIRHDEGMVAYVPPQRFRNELHPRQAFSRITQQIIVNSLRPDAKKLAEQFEAGINEIISNEE